MTNRMKIWIIEKDKLMSGKETDGYYVRCSGGRSGFIKPCWLPFADEVQKAGEAAFYRQGKGLVGVNINGLELHSTKAMEEAYRLLES